MTNTLATRKQAEAIRDRMQKIRNDLPYDADAARARVEELTDWKYHMRKHPWPILAAAAVLGYLVIPNKREQHVVHYSQGDTKRPAPPAKKSMMGGIVGALATLAIKQGTTIVTRRLSGAFFDSSMRDPDSTRSNNDEVRTS